MQRRTFTLAGLGAALAGGARAREAPPPPAPPPPADFIRPILDETKAPALAGAVVTPDGLTWLHAGGMRRAGSSDAVTTADLWHLGSNTKAMTAALYGKLVEQGKAKWGAVVPELFPGLKLDPAWSTTTIEALMSHTAGVSDKPLLDTAWLMSSRTDPRPLPEQRRALVAKAFHGPPAGKPGVFEYANADFIIAGAAIEQITGAPWEQVIQTELFTPLGMASAGFGAPKGDQPWGHLPDGTPVDPAGIADNPAALGPAGTVHCSLEDYAKFVRLFLTKGDGFLSPQTIDHLTTPPGVEDRGYALGWITFKHRPWAHGQALAHEGSNTLWHAVTLVGPGRGIAVITVSNSEAAGSKAAESLALKLVQQFAPA